MYEPVKNLGQNFLTDYTFVNKMVEALDLKGGDAVVEIGPGLGVLTERISRKLIGSGSVIYAIELDERFVSKLESMFIHDLDLHVVHADILKWLPDFEFNNNYKIIGSLPYYITSPILHATIKLTKRPDIAVYLIQKEVAQKVCSHVPDACYLSTFVQTFFDVEYLGMVPRLKFTPEPKVDGGIIKLVKKDVEFSLSQIEKYEGFLHKAFKNPRKMLNKAFDKNVLTSVEINPSARPQEVSISKWLNLFRVETGYEI